jgi:hypothetical protein
MSFDIPRGDAGMLAGRGLLRACAVTASLFHTRVRRQIQP